ncbi:MAG: rod shape-determining protein MreC [Gilvibacter sp.]
MQQLFNFFIRNKHFLLFCFLMCISLALTFQSRSYHSGKYVSAANFVSGGLYNWSSGVSDYFSLKDQNEILTQENAALREQAYTASQAFIDYNAQRSSVDSLQYNYRPAKVIRNSHSKSKNNLTIRGGSKQGIAAEMGVITSKGIVGIVQNVSKNYATVISILNTNSKINAKFLKSDHFGTLEWDTAQPNVVQLLDVPRLAPVSVGDTIITGGRSTIFPEGIGIGKVQSFKMDASGNYFIVQVALFNDMTSLSHVYVIENTHKEEILNLEQEAAADE